MRFISPRIHGFLDYSVAGALIGVPLLFDFAATSTIATLISVTAGVGLVVYSLLTDYSTGIRDLISWRTHLTLDTIAAIALVIVPFAFGFGGLARVFYVAVGVAVLAVVATTQLETDARHGVATGTPIRRPEACGDARFSRGASLMNFARLRLAARAFGPCAVILRPVISVIDLSKHYGDQTLFEGVSQNFLPGELYGIVGANGSGKSTFLRILCAEESASEGEIQIPKRIKLGVLRQDHFAYEDTPILDVVMMGHASLWKAWAEREAILANAETHFDGERFSELEDLIQREGGYTLESRAGEILEGLGIPSEVHREPLSVLSGGFKLRVLLAQVLASEPDVLLLDEPTNHLDIVSIRWLETFLADFPGTALLVSHDHRFLDNVATAIVDVDYETVKTYPGNYANFERAKREERSRREREIEKRQAQISEHQAFVDRFRAKATKARQAQSKLKQIERIEIETLAPSSRRYPRFRFSQTRPSGRQVLEVEGLSKAYDDKQVLENVSLRIERGERVAIIGPNGIGKSTLLKAVTGDIRADSGETTWGYEARIGYFAQDFRAQLDSPDQTVQDWLWAACPGETLGFVRGQLGAVLFSGDEAEKKLASLSGGEAARLVFSRHVIEKPNVLVLDEPTNHLDIEAIEALVTGLRDYDGTLLFVSHDRWFVSQLATRVIEISPSGIRDVKGSYEEFLIACGDDHLDADAVLRREREKKRSAKGKRGGKRRDGGADVARERRKIENRVAEVTASIATNEARLAELNEIFCDSNFFMATPRDEITRLESEHREVGESLEALMGEWEGLEKRLGELVEDVPSD